MNENLRIMKKRIDLIDELSAYKQTLSKWESAIEVYELRLLGIDGCKSYVLTQPDDLKYFKKIAIKNLKRKIKETEQEINKMETKIFKSHEDFLERKDKSINGVSEQFAKKHPDYKENNESNVGCWDCFNCTNCSKCEICIYCLNCKNCIKCNNCERCSECTKCDKCYSCTLCDMCKTYFYGFDCKRNIGRSSESIFFSPIRLKH